MSLKIAWPASREKIETRPTRERAETVNFTFGAMLARLYRLPDREDVKIADLSIDRHCWKYWCRVPFSNGKCSLVFAMAANLWSKDHLSKCQ